MDKRIYLDNSATTPVAAEVLEAMTPYFCEAYGNASSLHASGREARQAIEKGRAEIAAILGVSPSEIVFTSGATEANNLAIIGMAFAHEEKRHIITSKIEHHAVLHPCQWLESQGYEVTTLDVDKTGRIDLEQLKDTICKDTLLVSIMAGNNEIGTLQPVEEIGAICRERGVAFHTDAVQAYGKIQLPTDSIDLLSVSAHKLHGPKGVGFLMVRKGISLTPLLHGGGHEGGRRSGTENTPGIVGLAAASSLAFNKMEETTARMQRLKRRLIDAINAIPGTRLNGHETGSLPHIVNVSFQGIEGESLVMKLDEHG
ncbi:cysteine desulfurase, partial [Candidatus Bipolaricaulota bacterium]|nr:cysteine desulfurase [Candidatus Bipolaricaulota bacterium]